MKVCISLFIICLSVLSLQAQISRYRDYRELIIQAESYILVGDWEEALTYYRKAKREHGYMQVRDLNNAAVCASTLNYHPESAGFLLEMMRLGVPLDSVYYLPVFDKVWENKNINLTSQSALKVYEDGKKHRNLKFRKSLDSMNILLSRHRESGNPGALALAEGIYTVMQQWGYPSEQIIGVESPSGASLYDPLFDFIAGTPAASKYHTWLKKYLMTVLERGCTYPDKVALWMELMAGKVLFYPVSPVDAKEKIKLDKYRKDYYLPNTDVYKAKLQFSKTEGREAFHWGRNISGD